MWSFLTSWVRKSTLFPLILVICQARCLLQASLHRNGHEMFCMLTWEHSANQYNLHKFQPRGRTSQEVKAFLHFSAGALDSLQLLGWQVNIYHRATQTSSSIFEISAQSERFIVWPAWKWAPLTSTNGPDARPVIDGEFRGEQLRHCSGGPMTEWDAQGAESWRSRGRTGKLSFENDKTPTEKLLPVLLSPCLFAIKEKLYHDANLPPTCQLSPMWVDESPDFLWNAQCTRCWWSH